MNYRQIAELQKRAEERREAEMAEVVTELREKITEYGLTAKDLGFKTLDGPLGAHGTKPKRAAKYRDPQTGAEWSGMGKPPLWIAGVENRDAFLIDGQDDGGAAPAPARKTAAKKAPAKKAAKKSTRKSASAEA